MRSYSKGAEVLEPDGDTSVDVDRPRWNPLTRLAFRFGFVYFGLFCLIFPQILFVFTGYFTTLVPDSWIVGLWRPLGPIIEWAGRRIFGTDVALNLMSGSGDQKFIWAFVVCLLIVAVVATVAWTALDRHRPNYQRLNAWFLIFIRLCLGGQMLWYGLAKAIPTQMPEPSLTALLQPYGEFSPTSVLWNQVGSSPVYQILLGCAEVLGGLLLFLPRTATIGAMLSLVSMAQVFVLNMTFDVPVKILSLHLVLLSMVVLAPQARRLADMLVLQRPSEPATQPDPFRSRRVRAIAVAVQAVLGIWIFTGGVHMGMKYWDQGGGGTPEPPLYGIWTVSEFTMDGYPVPPLTTDENRWQRLVFDISGTTYQRMDGTLVPTLTNVDTAAHTIVVSGPPATPDAQPAPIANFTFDQPTSDLLRLTGQLNGKPVTITLEQVDLDRYPVHRGGFHWVQEYPNFR
ncbi:DoxX family protein [Nocardia australiensis]|uniref:DoxX family protein n=1 Tax=Nocardia australiensis TaxID=2887191 RepID=UPI001D152A0E|nr:DoxX family protein [Nocardia australiensis]